MKLLSCHLRSIRRHRELALDFHPGLTLITGANESGKSSLVEALHRCLFLRSTATGAPVRRLQTLQHGGLPEVGLRFEARGQTWGLRKRFSGQSGTTTLTGPGGSNLLGGEAEEQLASLLGISEIIGSRQAARVLPSRWAHLWVMQGDAGRDLLQLGGEHYDLRALIEELERRADDALQSPLDQHLHDQLAALVSASVTTRGLRQHSRQWQCEQSLQDARRTLACAEEDLDRFEQASAGLDALEDEQRALEQQQRPDLEQKRQTLLHQQQELGQTLARRKSLEQQLQPLEQHHQQLQLCQRRLDETVRRIDTHQRSLEQIDGELRRLEARHQEQTTQQQQQREAWEQCERERQTLETRGQELRRLEERLQLQERLDQLNRQERLLLTWQAQHQEVTQALNALQAPESEELQRLQDQQRQLDAVRVRRDAMASLVTLECCDQDVRINDSPLAAGASQRLSSTFVVTVGDGVTLRIAPGGGEGLDTLNQTEMQLQQAIQATLRRWTVDSLEDLVARSQRRTALQTRQTLLNQQRPECTDVSELRDQTAELMQRLETLASDGEAVADCDPKAITQELNRCRQRYRQLSDQGQRLQKQLQQHDQELRHQAETTQTLQLQREALLAETRSLAQQREILIRDQGDADALKQQLRSSQARIGALKADMAALGDPAASGDEQARHIARALEALEQQDQALLERLQTLSAERGALLERCASLGSHNPYALVEEARQTLNQADAAQRSAALELRAHQHLLQHFETARSDLANRYTVPLTDSITQYLTPLLTGPGDACSLSYDTKNGLGDLTLQRDGLPLPFASLSGGMREQLNAALRLALADTLRSGHDGCLPMLFDDAFSNTDPNRLEGVLTMLRQAVDRGLQVVVLSCDGAPYRRVADAVVALS